MAFVLYRFRQGRPMDAVVQGITILGLAVCLGMLYLRAKAARTQPPSNTKQRLKTAHMLLIALAVWLVINFNLQHLNGALSGQPAVEPSTWERIVRFLAATNASSLFPDRGFGGDSGRTVSLDVRPQGR